MSHLITKKKEAHSLITEISWFTAPRHIQKSQFFVATEPLTGAAGGEAAMIGPPMSDSVLQPAWGSGLGRTHPVNLAGIFERESMYFDVHQCTFMMNKFNLNVHGCVQHIRVISTFQDSRWTSPDMEFKHVLSKYLDINLSGQIPGLSFWQWSTASISPGSSCQWRCWR